MVILMFFVVFLVYGGFLVVLKGF